MAKTGEEDQLTSFGKVRDVVGLFAAGFLVTAQPYEGSISDRQELAAVIHGYRSSQARLKLTHGGLSLSIDRARGTAEMGLVVTAVFDRGDGPQQQQFRFRLGWMKDGGKWFVHDCELLEASGGRSPERRRDHVAHRRAGCRWPSACAVHEVRGVVLTGSGRALRRLESIVNVVAALGAVITIRVSPTADPSPLLPPQIDLSAGAEGRSSWRRGVVLRPGGRARPPSSPAGEGLASLVACASTACSPRTRFTAGGPLASPLADGLHVKSDVVTSVSVLIGARRGPPASDPDPLLAWWP
jgi:hypothetical protein